MFTQKVEKKEQEQVQVAERQKTAQPHPNPQSKVGQEGKENRVMMNSGETKVLQEFHCHAAHTENISLLIQKKNRFANFNLMQRSPLQLSAPNLRSENSGKSFKKYMPSFKVNLSF